MDLTGVGAVSDLIGTDVNKIWPDKTEKEKAELVAAVSLVQGQLDINKVEAANPSAFVSGARPFIMWICGVSLGYQCLVYPVLIAYIPKIQQADMGTLLTILLGMLGLGGMRTFEKLNGVATK